MMKKSKIATLLIIALIVTLIIGVTIMTLQNKNLFTHETNQEKKEEQDPRKNNLLISKGMKKS
ncbi:hypothetical protein HMPREF9378_0800 [Streptococcus sanguinis SK1 = NCTC 7863]|uniref:Uncharacterized protein n=1 Tax=Streptococcus sanguinis SK405 TaxID=888817 RepID=A0ABC9PF98_STRSA|nr:hypothetical protein HMPREF9390_0811 [Streptococcus sanguinis SK405]EGF07699.1 hypothetical protein HMPREF9378_0800 [Streptococcus sanguinis SK1 = NCTC 7863]MBZ2074572.1 hypothetical protein [Streptococcus sanguinis]SQG30118.1 Uncharacterised protein [Streptococcus sanguinis]